MQKYIVGSNAVHQSALESMASLDLIELCNEAKIEHCRATRDLSSCGRYVQHVLSSCGHASLCAECSQRCDICPICWVPLPTSGSKVRLRLFNKCIEEGLISKKYNDMFRENNDKEESLISDIQRLYCLFDVALENNLVSLIFHYIMDVCMDESAVSSDPIVAFLLDGKVVKEWCRIKFKNIVDELHYIYGLDIETMESKMLLLQKLLSQLSGISSVLEVLHSALGGAPNLQLHDLNRLFENSSKAKQHLEIITWCIRHKFLEDIESKFSSFAMWKSHVNQRKIAAIGRSWPNLTRDSTGAVETQTAMLFIEQALENLGIEESVSLEIDEQIDISSLRDSKSPLLFRSRIDEACPSYPFENLRAAVDILFLHGSSDMAVAKRAIFLYYIFDRQWSTPDADWRYVVDDFAECFGFDRHSLLESLVFYLLDDHTETALQEACNLLPDIARSEMHPKIGQVLLERRRPAVALAVMRCAGQDGLCASTSCDPDRIPTVSLNEAILAVRVKIECGLLTEAFMFQRMHCSKVKDDLTEGSFSNNSENVQSESWANHIEMLVSEICLLCIRRNLVDRFIELPWNSEEEKYLHECLFAHACRDPSSNCGSLLVVFYLQRYRYIEAYLVDRKLRSIEESTTHSSSEEVLQRMKLTSQWRKSLIDKALQLLPEAQRQQLRTSGHSANLDLSNRTAPPMPLSTSASMKPSLVLQTNHSSFPLTTSPGIAFAGLSSPTGTRAPEFGIRGPSILQKRLFASSIESPTFSETARKADGVISHFSKTNNGNISPSNGSFRGDLTMQDGFMFGHSSSRPSAQTTTMFNSKNTQNSLGTGLTRVSTNPRGAKAWRGEAVTRENPQKNDHSRLDSSLKGSGHGRSLSSGIKTPKLLEFPWSFTEGDLPSKSLNMRDVRRWRSDESSDEEVSFSLPEKHTQR